MLALTGAIPIRPGGPATRAGTRSVVGFTDAIASDDLRLHTMGAILDMLTWLAPMHIAVFYTVNEAGEKYAPGPIVAKISDAFPLSAEEGLSDYLKNLAARDPFAPCRLPDKSVALATLRDVPGARWYAQELATKFDLLPAANLYFHEGGQIVAGLSLVRKLRAARLSPTEIAMLQRCHGWFEFWYALSSRQNGAVGPHLLDPRLTEREREVLAELVKAKSYEVIAQELEISYATLKTHVKHVLRKLGAHNRVEAVAQVLGAVEPPIVD